MVGRRLERELLVERLRRLRNQKSSVIVLEGEGGIGKSTFVQYALAVAEKLGIRCLVGAADAIEMATLYYPWRAIFQQLFDLDGSIESAEAGREKVLSQLAEQPVGRTAGAAAQCGIAIRLARE